ncbi:hypothetical protein KI387_012940, partial [Taxus chinensis]
HDCNIQRILRGTKENHNVFYRVMTNGWVHGLLTFLLLLTVVAPRLAVNCGRQSFIGPVDSPLGLVVNGGRQWRFQLSSGDFNQQRRFQLSIGDFNQQRRFQLSNYDFNSVV